MNGYIYLKAEALLKSQTTLGCVRHCMLLETLFQRSEITARLLRLCDVGTNCAQGIALRSLDAESSALHRRRLLQPQVWRHSGGRWDCMRIVARRALDIGMATVRFI